MKKLLLSIACVLTFACIMQGQVFAANVYTPENILDGRGIFEAGATVNFANEVEVIFEDAAGKELSKQNASSIVLPAYTPETSSFKGWITPGPATSNGKWTRVTFTAVFKTTIQFNQVTKGESITVSVPEKEIPFAKGEYTTEWIMGGMAGGYALAGAPKDSLSWTIDPTSEHYQNGMKIALRIKSKANGINVFSEEAVLVIKDKVETPVQPEKPNPTKPNPTTPEKKPGKQPVQTADTQGVVGYITFMVIAGGLYIVIKSKKA